MKLTAFPIELPLKGEFKTAARTASTSPTVLVKLEAGDMLGWGEATPLTYVTGETVDTVLRDIRRCEKFLCGFVDFDFQKISGKLFKTRDIGAAALAAVQMALWDMLGKTCAGPVYDILADHACKLRSIETDVTIAVTSSQESRIRAREMSARGFRLFKVKVGVDFDEDIARCRVIDESVPVCRLILDANQGFEPQAAINFIRHLRRNDVDIALFEQPVDADDIDGMSYVTEHAGVPVFADESAKTLSDILKIRRHNAAHGINIKLMKFGFDRAVMAAMSCRRYGLKMMLGCMLESGIAQSAAAHIALGMGCFDYIDLDADLLIADQPVVSGALRKGSELFLSNGPGFGCEVVESALEAFVNPDYRFES